LCELCGTLRLCANHKLNSSKLRLWFAQRRKVTQSSQSEVFQRTNDRDLCDSFLNLTLYCHSLSRHPDRDPIQHSRNTPILSHSTGLPRSSPKTIDDKESTHPALRTSPASRALSKKCDNANDIVATRAVESQTPPPSTPRESERHSHY